MATGLFAPRGRRPDGSLRDYYEESASVARRANRETERAMTLSALRNQRIQMIRQGISPMLLPEIHEGMSPTDITNAQARMQSVVNRSAASVNRAQMPGTIIPRQDPVANTAQQNQAVQALAGAGQSIANAINPLPAVAAGPMDATAPTPIQTAEHPLAAAIRANRPDLADADIQITPAGAHVMMQGESGPRLVPFDPGMHAVMDSKTGGQWSKMQPSERAETLRQMMPTAPQRFVSETGPESVYSDELGRDRGPLDGIRGQTKMGVGTRNPDGSYSSIRGGMEVGPNGELRTVTPVSGGPIVSTPTGKMQLTPGKYQTPGAALPQSFWSPEDIARANNSGQPKVAPAPGALDFVGPVQPKAGIPVAKVAKKGPKAPISELEKTQAEIAKIKEGEKTRSMIAAADAADAAVLRSENSKLAGVKQELENLRNPIDRTAGKPIGNSTVLDNQPKDPMKPDPVAMQRALTPPAAPAPNKMKKAYEAIFPEDVKTGGAPLGQDNKGTGSSRAVAPTPLGITSTTNDVVDHFARNPEEDQMRKRLTFSGFGSYA